jgi:major type 1 subunit fimbrin (pilin)
MKMLTIAIPALLMAGSAFAIEGERSTVNFTGNIVKSTCALVPGSANQSVQLGDVAANVFTGANSTSTETDFTIDLQDCDTSSATNASLTFNGETVNDTTLKTSAGDKTNVGIQILQNGAPLVLNGSTASDPYELKTGNINIPFSARYIALNDDIGVGEANATVNFTLNYE